MIRRFSLPLSRPLDTAAGAIDEREGFLFARDGGIGEATPLPGWTESLDACEQALRRADQAATWDDALAACEDAPAARHAVSLAHLDRQAKTAGESLAAHLAADPADSVPVNATVGDADREATVTAAEQAERAGYESLKVKVGAREVPTDVARLEAVADATDLTPRADANGAWTREQAREAFDALGALGLDYVEQPLPADDLDGHAGLAGHDVDVALDESLAANDLDAVLDVADHVILKPMALGGIDRALAAARRARAESVEPVVTTTIDGVVARAAAVHLAASIPDVPACGLATAEWLASDLAPDPAPVERGRIVVPEEPGHGVEVTVDA